MRCDKKRNETLAATVRNGQQLASRLCHTLYNILPLYHSNITSLSLTNKILRLFKHTHSKSRRVTNLFQLKYGAASQFENFLSNLERNLQNASNCCKMSVELIVCNARGFSNGTNVSRVVVKKWKMTQSQDDLPHQKLQTTLKELTPWYAEIDD